MTIDPVNNEMELKRPPSVTNPTTASSAPSKPRSTTARTKLDSHPTSEEEISSISKKQFDLLRPITIQVMSSPSIINLTDLIHVIELLPATVDDCILDYVIFPLSHHLKLSNKLKDDVLIRLHDCVKVVLNKWQIPNFTFFAELYQFCMMSICKEDDPGSYDKSMSENVVERIVVSIHTLIEKSLSKHFKKLYSEKYIAAVGHGICILLQIVNQDTTKSLRIQAIRTIVFLIRACEADDDACHRIFKFLPGLATTFVRCSIIQGGRFQVDVIKESLGALKVSLITCISRENAETLVPVDTNLSPGVIEISESLLFHDDKRLRDSLADLTLSVLQETKMKLPKCSETLWNNILVFAGNVEDKELSSKCLNFLKNSNNKTLSLALCNFKAIEHHLKKAVIQSNIGELTKCCLTAHGAAGALAVYKLSFTELRSILPRIADLRTTTVRRQQEYEDKRLKTQDHQIANSCVRMCQFILESQEVEVVIAEFFTLLDRGNNLEDVTTYRSSGTILLMNEVLMLFLSKKPPNLDYNLVETITEKYLTLLCPLPIVIEVPASEKKKLAATSKKVELAPGSTSGISIHTCSILQAFPTFTKLEPLLLHLVTFPLLEYAGLREADYTLVSKTAVESLTQIATLSNLSLREYLGINLDLVMSEFGSRTEVIADYPHMADALIFLAEYFDFTQSRFLQFVEQIIQFSTSQKLDHKYHQMFTNIYQAYILSMWKHYYEKVDKSPVPSYPTEEKEFPPFLDRLIDYQKALGICPSHFAGEDTLMNLEEKLKNVDLHGGTNKDQVLENGTNENEEEEEHEVKKPLPPEISLTLKIARKAAGYLAGETREIKLNSMEILIKAIQLLSMYQDELLPLLHQCWEPLVARFKENEYVVLRKAFELLLAMVNSSGDFLRRRTIDGIFPILSKFLEELAEEAKNIEDKNVVYYTFTQGFKLQHTILTGLADLCEVMEIGERDLDRVADACLIYLAHSIQHNKLREAAVELMLILADGHCGASIWMKLIANGIIPLPEPSTNKEFRTFPADFTNPLEEAKAKRKAGKSRIGK